MFPYEKSLSKSKRMIFTLYDFENKSKLSHIFFHPTSVHDLEAALRGDPKVTQGAWNLQIFLFPLHPLSLVVGGIMPRKCWGNHHILMTIVLSSHPG